MELLIDNVYAIFQDAVEDGINLREIITLLLGALIFTSWKSRKAIHRKVVRWYKRFRQVDEIEALEEQSKIEIEALEEQSKIEIEALEEQSRRIKVALYKSLRQFLESEKEFKAEVDKIINKFEESQYRKNHTEDSSAINVEELKSLRDFYEHPLLEVKRLYKTISSSLERADEINETKSMMAQKAAREEYSQEEVHTFPHW
jgi:hypothetical protein